MAFVNVATLADIPAGTARVYRIGDREIALCNVEGELYAIDNVCTHDDGSLDQGELDGCEVECPRHGARFDVRNGKAVEGPAILPVDTFDVRVDGDGIEVNV